MARVPMRQGRARSTAAVKPELVKMSEAELQDNVIKTARAFKWRVAHFRSVPVKHGDRVVYETPVQADGAGFPDLLLVRERVVFAELKSETGRMSMAQQDWMFALREADAERYIWFPKDWISGEIEEVLR